MLEREFNFYKVHQEELVKQFSGKFVVIHDEAVIGAFDSEIDALTESQKKFPIGSFLIQQVMPGSDGYTQTFHSRVAFAPRTV